MLVILYVRISPIDLIILLLSNFYVLLLSIMLLGPLEPLELE